MFKFCLFLTLFLLSMVTRSTRQQEEDEKLAFSQTATFAHNYVRELHSVASLAWDVGLAREAQEYADALAELNSMESSGQQTYGENTYKGFERLGYAKTMADAVLYWYYEMYGYQFSDENPDTNKHGRFTQLVWKGTTRVGCGRTHREKYGGVMTYIVCRYHPKGNVPGMFDGNVFVVKDYESVPKTREQLQSASGCVDIMADGQCQRWLNVCHQSIFKQTLLKYCKRTCGIC